MRFLRLFGVLAAILALAGCAGAAATPSPSSSAPSPSVSAGPRVIEIAASDDLRFSPATVSVKAGEAVIFRVKNVGKITHELMVGPTAAVEANSGDGTVELEDIEGSQTKDLPFTFGSTGTFAFACHVPGHFESGMKGTVTIAP